MLGELYWLTTGALIVGAIINIRKNVLGFYIWAVADLILAYQGFMLGAYNIMVGNLIFFILAVYGIIDWSYPELINSKIRGGINGR